MFQLQIRSLQINPVLILSIQEIAETDLIHFIIIFVFASAQVRLNLAHKFIFSKLI